MINDVILPVLQTKMMPQMLAEMPKIYAINFSADELRQLLFYQSDIGRKLIERQPEIVKQTSAMSQVIAKSIIPEILDKLQNESKARGLKCLRTFESKALLKPQKDASMKYWLVKSEPTKWSWDDQVRAGTINWDGVRNATAIINLKAMRLGDRAFFYHSNEGKEIVGVVEIVREFYPDPKDPTGRFGMVDVKAIEPVPKPVTLSAAKAEPKLAGMALVRLSRLSVGPVSVAEWQQVSAMGGLQAKGGARKRSG